MRFIGIDPVEGTASGGRLARQDRRDCFIGIDPVEGTARQGIEQEQRHHSRGFIGIDPVEGTARRNLYHLTTNVELFHWHRPG